MDLSPLLFFLYPLLDWEKNILTLLSLFIDLKVRKVKTFGAIFGLVGWSRLPSSRSFARGEDQLWVAQDPKCSCTVGHTPVLPLGRILQTLPLLPARKTWILSCARILKKR